MADSMTEALPGLGRRGTNETHERQVARKRLATPARAAIRAARLWPATRSSVSWRRQRSAGPCSAPASARCRERGVCARDRLVRQQTRGLERGPSLAPNLAGCVEGGWRWRAGSPGRTRRRASARAQHRRRSAPATRRRGGRRLETARSSARRSTAARRRCRACWCAFRLGRAAIESGPILPTLRLIQRDM